MLRSLPHTIGAAVCFIVGLLMLASLGTSPAAATQNDFEYRVNSGVWSADPPALFDEQWAPVPGSTRSVTLEIRSLREIPTVLTVHAAQMSTGSSELSRLTTLQTADQLITFETAETCAELAPQTMLQPGEIYTLPLTLTLDPTLTSAVNTTINFQLALSLSDAGPSTHANGCPMDPVIVHAYPAATTAKDQLEISGSSTPQFAVTGGLVLVGAGVIVLMLSAGKRLNRASQNRS